MINFPVSDWMPDAKIPSGPIQDKWSKYKLESKLINPNNKRKYTVLVVGSGLAGASAAATLAELGYNVKCFCYQDSPRRAHSIAAQGGINAAKNYQNDGDSVYRLFYDTVHTVNAKDYTEEQLDAWADGKPDAAKWNESLCAHFSLAAEADKGRRFRLHHHPRLYYSQTFF